MDMFILTRCPACAGRLASEGPACFQAARVVEESQALALCHANAGAGFGGHLGASIRMQTSGPHIAEAPVHFLLQAVDPLLRAVQLDLDGLEAPGWSDPG